MIAELVKQYDTLKKCGISLPDPYFEEKLVSAEIQLKAKGSFDKVTWLCKPKESVAKKTSRKQKEEPCLDINCPVTETSACRSSGNDSPHGFVDNPTWLFGELAPESKPQRKGKEDKKPPGTQRREAYLKQLRAIRKTDPDNLRIVCLIYRAIWRTSIRSQIWQELECLLKEKIHSKNGRTFDVDPKKWKDMASKMNIRWVIESTGSQGKPVHSLESVRNAWVKLQKKQGSRKVISILDGKEKPARILHPRIKGASLISFNDAATYCGHLHESLSQKKSAKGKDESGSALPAQIGFEEAEKYSMALKWLVNNSSIRFGDSTNCIWIDQSDNSLKELDNSALGLVSPQGTISHFSLGKAKRGKGQVLADSSDLLEAMRRYRNAQEGHYRDKRFYFLSILLRKKGRHAILGGFTGTMGELEDNTNTFIEHSSVQLPGSYIAFKDDVHDFCPTLMDILDAAGIISQTKKRLVWDREVVEVIVRGRPLPPDLCRQIVLKAIKQKHKEQSQETRMAYRKLLAIAAGSARHYLLRIAGKENYQMGLDTSIADPGYLAGRLFAICENIQKRGRNWGPTLSDKHFSAGIERPRDTLGQLYQNCLCYEIYKKDGEWFTEIFDKVKLKESAEGNGTIMPNQGVDSFEFLLGYWNQRCAIKTTTK
ncbi:MAG: type I-C CRISPR-associated protein Cas8c/Csd1 [Phycisphaerae bacterium]|nr:type I-C CRISPR-associated protein Cas8c/Csd1 [Phycisphaerae bacterium]